MKNRRFAALVAVVLFCFIGWSGYAQGQRSYSVKQTWEYRAMTFNGTEAEKAAPQMNQLGADGWELVACGTTNGWYVCYFKRPK